MKLETDTMNATERALAIINHEEPDRVSTYIMGIPPYSKCYKEFLEREDEIFGDGSWGDDDDNILLTPMGDYTLKYYFGADIEMTGIGIITGFRNLLLDADGSVNEDPAALSNLPKGTEARYVSYFGTISGIKILPTGDRYTWYLDGFLKKKEDALAWYDRYGWPHEKPVDRARVKEYKQFQKEFGDRIFLIPQIGGVQLYESTWVIMGQARWAYYCRKDPDYIHKLIDSRKEAQLKILDEIAKYDPKIIFGGDDMGQKGRPLISPAMYRKFFKEPYKEIFKKVHEELGAKIFNHSCGNIVELLPDMIDAGLDGWQSLEPASGIDHEMVKKKYGDRFLLVGGIDSREISFGSKESIQRHIKQQIKRMGKGGGYIAGPTHDFLTETPLDNCLAMRDAIQEFGKYPL
ncbi:MAG: uroporphyrinogen decarboxylase family protein [Promethearchaeota archaeon]